MADEIRRVRTQAERDADGQAWRAVANSRPGYATWPQTAPGDPSWWRRPASPITVTPGQVVSQSAWVALPPPVEGETCPKWCGFCHLNNGEPVAADPLAEASAAVGRVLSEHLPALGEALAEIVSTPPRRRWWHRLTRRAGTAWYCGAFQPDPPPRMKPYRCTEPADHAGNHRAVLDGEVLAEWHRLTRRNP